MPKWLQEMVAPTLMLWIYAVAQGIASALGSDLAELAASVVLPLVISLWVMADARKRRRKLCYDYDTFAYFGWPVVVPVYLFQTRGARAFLTLLCFVGIWLIAVLAAAVIFFIRAILS